MAASANEAPVVAAEASPAPAPSIASNPSHVRVYTRTGDGGTTSLFTGERRPKDDDVFHALGDVDELNAHIGVAAEHAKTEGFDVEEQLREVQSRLLDVGSAVATPLSTASEARKQRTAFDGATHVAQLESWIDAMDAALPPLRNFILPSGGLAATHMHVARTVCRRAERAVTKLVLAGHVPADAGRYLNRLSDYLFVAARAAAQHARASEKVYKKAAGVTERPLV